MKMTIIPIVIGAFGTVTKGTGGLGARRTSGDHPNYNITENGQNTEEYWRLEETCCHSNSSERRSANTDGKNPQGVKNDYYNNGHG